MIQVTLELVNLRDQRAFSTYRSRFSIRRKSIAAKEDVVIESARFRQVFVNKLGLILTLPPRSDTLAITN